MSASRSDRIVSYFQLATAGIGPMRSDTVTAPVLSHAVLHQTPYGFWIAPAFFVCNRYLFGNHS